MSGFRRGCQQAAGIFTLTNVVHTSQSSAYWHLHLSAQGTFLVVIANFAHAQKCLRHNDLGAFISQQIMGVVGEHLIPSCFLCALHCLPGPQND